MLVSLARGSPAGGGGLLGLSLGLRLLPYQAVGVQCGLLLAVRLDQAAWGTQRRCPCLAALSPTPLSDGGGYHALVGGELA